MSVTQSSVGFLGNVADPLPRVRPQDVGLSPERLARIAEVLNADIAAAKMPGAVLAIARRGKLAFLEILRHARQGRRRRDDGRIRCSISHR